MNSGLWSLLEGEVAFFQTQESCFIGTNFYTLLYTLCDFSSPLEPGSKLFKVYFSSREVSVKALSLTHKHASRASEGVGFGTLISRLRGGDKLCSFSIEVPQHRLELMSKAPLPQDLPPPRHT